MNFEVIFLSMISLILALCVISIIFKDNPLFRFAESTIIGTMGGHFTLMALISIKDGLLIPLSEGKFYLIFILLLGITIFGRFTKWPWLARYPVAIMVGTGLGLSVRATIDAQIISQITATMLPLNTPSLVTNISNIIFVLGTLVSLLYFVFTVPLKGPMKKINTIGRLFLMMTFGAGAATYIVGMYTSMGSIFLYIIDYIKIIFFG